MQWIAFYAIYKLAPSIKLAVYLTIVLKDKPIVTTNFINSFFRFFNLIKLNLEYIVQK
jgi:hypothetical protein